MGYTAAYKNIAALCKKDLTWYCRLAIVTAHSLSQERKMQTLIQIQEAAIAKLDVNRSSERRYAKLRGSVARWYVETLTKRGWPIEQARATWKDVRDMSELNRLCADEVSA